MANIFDTLTAARRLKEAGVAEPAAEAIVEVLLHSREFDLSQLATKADLGELRADLAELKSATKADIVGLKADIAELKVEILKWVIGLMIAQTAAIVAWRS